MFVSKNADYVCRDRNLAGAEVVTFGDHNGFQIGDIDLNAFQHTDDMYAFESAVMTLWDIDHENNTVIDPEAIFGENDPMTPLNEIFGGEFGSAFYKRLEILDIKENVERMENSLANLVHNLEIGRQKYAQLLAE